MAPSPRSEIGSTEQTVTESYVCHSSHRLYYGRPSELRHDDNVSYNPCEIGP